MSEVDQSMVDRFNAAYNKNKVEKEAKEKQRKGGGSGGGGFEVVEWCGLEDQKEKVVRIVGGPAEFRQFGSDVKLIYHSKLLTDKKDGYMNIVWPSKDGAIDEDWILYELYSRVFKKEWTKYADGHKNEKGHDGEYAYSHKDTETYKRLDANLKKDASPKFFPPKSKPKCRAYMNVIDRHDTWCADNNHTKILTSKLSYWKDDQDGNPINFPDPGTPEMVYNNIMEQVVQYRHNWDLDIVIKKNSKDLNNAYVVKDIKEEKILDETKALGNSDPLTEVEKNYETYDFDKLRMTTVTPYYAIYNRLVGLFKMFDAEFNADFTSRLEKLVEAEKEKLQQEKNQEIDEDFENETETSAEVPVETKVEAPVEEKPSAEAEVSEEPKARRSAGINYVNIFPSWESLKDVEKEQMKKNIVSTSGGVPTYLDPGDALPCVDSECKFKDSTVKTVFPSTVATCPVCGKVDNS